LKKEMEEDKRHPMDAKRALAREIVERYYDGERARMAEEQFHQRYSARKPLEELSGDESIPAFEMETEHEMPLFKVLHAAGITGSSSEAIRLVKAGAVRIRDEKVTDTQFKVTTETGVIKAGRKFIRITKK
jgi:tyrosyl-tRNA synthetase